ncbi:apolipoprotein D-like isoform X2 [Cimex lectularius]|nr:apolipoprotein D-like isoform X2 [Cimex lectularius]
MQLLIILSSILVLTHAQVPFLGPCPEMKTMENFDVSQYMGKWYEAERYFDISEFGGRCVNSNYTDGANVSIKLIHQQTSSLTGTVSKVQGEVIKAEKTYFPAKMVIKFPYLPGDAPYWVLDTDYVNYSVVWSCSDFGILSTRNAWILTRERNPSIETMENAYRTIDKNFISRAFFIRTDQTNCQEDN